MRQASVLKNLNFGIPLWEETHHFGTPKFWINFIFLLHLLTLNTSCFQLKRFKNEFWKASLGETPHFSTSIFVRFNLFLISTYFENLIHLPLTVKRWQHISGGPSIFGKLKFYCFWSYLHALKTSSA